MKWTHSSQVINSVEIIHNKLILIIKNMVINFKQAYTNSKG